MGADIVSEAGLADVRARTQSGRHRQACRVCCRGLALPFICWR